MVSIRVTILARGIDQSGHLKDNKGIKMTSVVIFKNLTGIEMG
jgi:hypothetical protein